MSVGGNRDPPPALIDVDCNLLHPDLLGINSAFLSDDDGVNSDPTLILQHPSTTQSNIVGVLSPASTLEETERSLAFPALVGSVQIRVTAGVHPYHTEDMGAPYVRNDDDDDDDDVEEKSPVLHRLQDLIANHMARGDTTLSCVGECGLDYSSGFPDKNAQLPWFRAQVTLAYDFHLPLFLHERAAFRDTLDVLDDVARRHPETPPPNTIVHCFTGTREECTEYVDRGYSLSLSGFFLRRPAGQTVRQCLVDNLIPPHKLMLETDAPYMGFKSCRDAYLSHHERELHNNLSGKKRKRLRGATYPNVPSGLVAVLDGVTEALNEGRAQRGEALTSRKEVAEQCTNNAKAFFGFQ